MRIGSLLCVLGLACSGNATAIETSGVSTDDIPSTVAPELSVQEQAFVDQWSALRSAEGREAVRLDATLTRAARDYSCQMGRDDHFDHTGKDGSTYQTRMCDAGFAAACESRGMQAENIAAGQATGDAVFVSWRDSAFHRDNMLNAAFRLGGVGYCEVAGGSARHYWTLVLASEP